MRSIITTGEDNIFSIIEREYHPLDDTQRQEIMKLIAAANPQIVSLYSLMVGQEMYLPDYPAPVFTPELAASTDDSQAPASTDDSTTTSKKGK